jgi:hypothetical protein
VILTLGAVRFDPFTNFIDLDHGLYCRVNVDEQMAMGRHVMDTTLDWWAKQDPEVMAEALGDENRVSVDEMTRSLNKSVVGIENIWCQGPVFDICILENLYRQINKPAPWNYWQIRDSRTLFGVHGDPREKGRKAAHNALMDCYYQAEGIQQIYKRQGIEKRKW